jgi:hypothetical protein
MGMRMQLLFWALVLALTAGFSTAARADGWNAWMEATTIEGCRYRQFTRGYDGVETEEYHVMKWTGICTSGQPINGTGSLETHTYFEFRDPGEQRYVEIETGKMVNGTFDGIVTVKYYNVSDAGIRDFEPSEEWQRTYKRGCVTIDGDQEIGDWCDPFEGTYDKWGMAKRPLYKVASAASTTAPKAATVTPPTTAAANTGATFTVMPTGLTIEKREKAYDAVAGTLLAAITGDPSTIGTGSKLLDRVIASLTGSLRAGGGQDLIGGNGGLLDVLLGEVRSALGTNLPSNTNQLVDLAMGELKRALTKPRAVATEPVVAATAATTSAGQFARQPVNVATIEAALAIFSISINATHRQDRGILLETGDMFVSLLGCTDDSSCKTVQMKKCGVNENISLSKVNLWNAEHIYPRLSMSEGTILCRDVTYIDYEGHGSIASLSFTYGSLVTFDKELDEWFK